MRPTTSVKLNIEPKKIWIDLANSPHVIFFIPIIKRLKNDGHTVLITMRNFAQTVPLAEKFGIQGDIIGKHGGANRLSKFLNLVKRTNQLVLFAKNKSIDIAVSHNSYAHTIAGRMIGAKVITLMDYEGQPANHLAFRTAHKVLVPQAFPNKLLFRFGASENKTFKYQGFKEQLYLSNFDPDNNFIKELTEACNTISNNLSNKVIVSVRTPPTMALYHHFKNDIFEKLLENLNSNPLAFTIVSPRTKEQHKYIKHKFRNLHIPSKSLNGMNLCYYSDLVISAGGTMNREAAILGTPAYSLFAGSMPAVDAELIKTGRMFHISNENDLGKINIAKLSGRKILSNDALLGIIIHEILH